MALEFDYVHILGLHEFTGLDINPRIGPLINAQRSSGNPARILAPQFAAHAAELTAAFGTPTPFGRITVAQSDGRSRYDAFTASFKKRYANKYQLNAHYTLAKSQAWFGATQDFGLQPQNLFDKLDPINFGPTAEDERHRFVLSGIFDLPVGLPARADLPAGLGASVQHLPGLRLRHKPGRRDQRPRVRQPRRGRPEQAADKLRAWRQLLAVERSRLEVFQVR